MLLVVSAVNPVGAGMTPIVVDTIASADGRHIQLELDKDWCKGGGCPIIFFECTEPGGDIIFKYTAVGIGSLYARNFPPNIYLKAAPDPGSNKRTFFDFGFYSLTRENRAGDWTGVYDTNGERERFFEILSLSPTIHVSGPFGYLALNTTGGDNALEFGKFMSRCMELDSQAG